MDSELGFYGIALAVISLPGLLAPRLMWELFSGLSYRNPERIEPSNRRFRVARLGSATMLNIGLVFAVLGLWTGDKQEAGTAGAAVGLIGAALIITGTIIAAVTRSRRHAHDADGDLPPNEPSDLSYGFEYFTIIFYLAIAVIVSIVLANAGQPAAQESTTPVAQGESAADDFLSRNSTVHVLEYPVFDAVPLEMVPLRSPSYSRVVVATHEPYSAWFQSQTEFADSPELGDRLALISGALNSADLVVRYFQLNCPVAGLVVRETEDSVTIGAFTKVEAVPVPSPTATSHPGDPSESCFRSGITSDWYPIYLEQPLGERAIIGLDGNQLSRIAQ